MHNCNAQQTCVNSLGSFTCSGDDEDELCPECPTCGENAFCAINDANVPTCECLPGFDGDPFTRCNDIDECQKVPLAVCTDAYEVCINSIGSYSCTCERGFQLNETTCEDIDECSNTVPTHNCNITDICHNTIGSFWCEQECPSECPECVQYAQCNHTSGDCECIEGFTGDGSTQCDDIDECTLLVDTCKNIEICINSIGSYICTCPNGYAFNTSGLCSDINECDPVGNQQSTIHNCDVIGDCRNTIGSFYCDETCENITCPNCGENAHCVLSDGITTCECDDGYEGNAYTGCTDINECDNTALHVCDEYNPVQDCINVNGSYGCACTIGFEHNDNDPDCDDINECANEVLNNCNTNQTCVNTYGSYFCSGNDTDELCPTCDDCGLNAHCVVDDDSMAPLCKCYYGYLGDPLVECHDIDECSTSSHNCTIQEVCSNVIGSYLCNCPIGYTMNTDTGVCEDIDECDSNVPSHHCVSIDFCENTIGSFTCADNCTTIDCPDCGTNAHCTNGDGELICACQTGFAGNPDVNCIDIDECTSNVHQCPTVFPAELCINSEGSYVCECPCGFDRNITTTTCDDIDECLDEELNNCDIDVDICVNTIGSFYCVHNETDICPECPPCGLNAGCVVNESDSMPICKCISGFNGNPYINCTDVNECKDTTLNNCHLKHPIEECINSIGGYVCNCPNGYMRNNVTFVCNDVNECMGDIIENNCFDNQTCHNTIGSYMCYGDDTDELCPPCGMCGTNAACIVPATIGLSPYCNCESGYYGDPATMCDDIDECANKTLNSCDGQDGLTSTTCIAQATGVVDLTCPDEMTIRVIDAHYGRDVADICCTNSQISNGKCNPCVGTDILGYTQSNCNGYQNCSVSINNVVFPDDSNCLSTREYANISWDCIPTRGHVCQNTPGSYICVCPDGYILNPITNVCEDIDECAHFNTHKCHVNQTCENTLGTYICTGTITNITCPDCPDCAVNAECIVEEDLPVCKCIRGYDGDPYIQCDDINECTSIAHACDSNSPAENCVNAEGSFVCVCPDGYGRNDTTLNCEDIDECDQTDQRHNCVNVDLCVNTIGSFDCIESEPCPECPDCGLNAACVVNETEPICECNNGFAGDPYINCTDIDECANTTLSDCHLKHPVEICINSLGSYVCNCPNGYMRNNITFVCDDVNECIGDIIPNNCFENQTCHNTIGSYMCYGDDTDELCPPCGMCGTNAACIVPATIGLSPYCNCESGYYGDPATMCEDIDECANKTLNSCDGQDGLTSTTCIAQATGVVDLACPHDMTIIVTRAHYGRDEADICCTSSQINNAKCNPCVGTDILGYTQSNCDGRQNCSVPINNIVFPDDTNCANTREYANISWDCVPTRGHVCQNTPGSYICVCPTGYTLNVVTNVCEDIDECGDFTLDNCHVNQTCENTIGSYVCTGTITNLTCPDCPDCAVNAECVVDTDDMPTCQCIRGYTGDPNVQCDDIDECSQNLDDCDSNIPSEHCVNADGSYVCVCPDGYDRNDTTLNCDDTDECDSTNPRHNCISIEMCTNTIGSFECTYNCTNGTLLDCPDCGENAHCTVVNDDLDCICDDGYVGDPVTNCIDINECNDVVLNTCALQSPVEDCINTNGSFACTCQNGFGRNESTDGCEDINECLEPALNNCFANQTCLNNIGSYVCLGNDTDIICPDCGQCGLNALCVLQDAIAECECLQGYEGNPDQSCSDINECTTNIATDCGVTEVCVNTPGSYVCRCPEGHTVNAITLECEDDDECSFTQHDCHESQTCENTIGSYVCNGNITDEYCPDCPVCGDNAHCTVDTDSKPICECVDGYIGDAYVTCDDIDECFYGNHTCNGTDPLSQNLTCVNAPGTFVCICPEGFYRNETTGECEDLDECDPNAVSHPCITIDSCSNTVGSYECNIKCPPCGANSYCTVANNTLQCECNDGFEGDPLFGCTDINECLNITIGGCDIFGNTAECINVDGGAICNCLTGFGGPNCDDVDECANFDDTKCFVNQTCVNTVGSYICGSDNETDICPNCHPCGTNAHCTVLDGITKCECDKGYDGFPYGICDDIDECSNSTLNVCDQPASFEEITCTAQMTGTVDLTCPTGEVIHVQYAHFGRTTSSPCCTSQQESTGKCNPCVGIDILAYIQLNCDGKQNCTILVNEGVFPTDTTCPGTREYANVTWHCKKPISTTCLNTPGSYICACPEGTITNTETGECDDIDECSDLSINRCHANQTCINTLGTYICDGTITNITCPDCPPCVANAECIVDINNQPICQCWPGYTGDPLVQCDDIDECDQGTDGCSEIIPVRDCVNTNGSYVCICQNGYVINSTSDQCDDIDECDVTAPVHNCIDLDLCRNTIGSFYCESNCTNTTMDCPTCGANAYCTLGADLLLCVCQEGYDGDPYVECIDINECDDLSLSTCHQNVPTEQCINVNGSYACDCPTGYGRNVSTTNCDDIDECVDPTLNNCHTNQTCFNTYGSYICVGNETDIVCPECGQCADNADCIRGDSLMECECRPGYSGDPYGSCDDINECNNSTLHVCNEKLQFEKITCTAQLIGVVDLTCPNGTVIDVISAHYGRNDQSTCCTKRHMKNNKCNTCVGVDALVHSRDHCDGQQNCSMPFNEAIFNTTTACAGTREYANVSWYCVPPMPETCVNMPGSYICACPAGFERNPVTGECEDVDECVMEIHRCHANATCLNEIGSYNCDCNGLDDPGNGFDCVEMLLKCPNCGNNADCRFNGTTTCECYYGFEGDPYTDCSDINECLENSTLPHDCDTTANATQGCENTEGSYTCRCPSGMVYNPFGKSCEDVDECLTGSHKCHQNATCTNINGDYICSCEPPLVGNGLDCINIECPSCGDHAYCTWNGTQMVCVCSFGFEGDPYTGCTDINECLSNSTLVHNCHTHTPVESCVNSEGSYSCCCPDGYYRNQTTDLCEIIACPTCGANAHCNSIGATFFCECQFGYEGDPYSGCADINECIADSSLTHNCESFTPSEDCVNSEGSYSCCCPYGFHRNETTALCEVMECPACGAHAYCTTNGTDLICECTFGFEGDPYAGCTDINECITGNALLHDCDSMLPVEECVNSEGSYSCCCPDGYDRNDITGICEDVDECQNTAINICDVAAICSNTDGSYDCDCLPNYYGNGYYCISSNETLPDCPTCALDRHCTINQTGSLQSIAAVCKCNPGYTENGTDCVEINECLNVPSLCDVHQECMNTPGSYLCLCPDGYEMSGSNCIDIDECIIGLSNCHQNATCSNINGAYDCDCTEGFVGSGRNCINETLQCEFECPDCGINAYCNVDDTLTSGFVACTCYDGFVGDPYVECIDIDECTAQIHDCGVTSDCVNLNGTFTCYERCPTCTDTEYCNWDSSAHVASCICKDGYILDQNGNCIDVDECMNITLNTCFDNSALCINTIGSYHCECPVGYAISPATGHCEDTNECVVNNHMCHSNADCSNTDGSYVCTCHNNYIGNGLYCHPNCTVCGANTDCTINQINNLPICTCREGYTGDIFTGCIDINECTNNICDDNEICVNAIGSYACICRNGYQVFNHPGSMTQLPDTNCIDIDECTGINICSGNATCSNTIGSYNCVCDTGFYGDGEYCHPECPSCGSNTYCTFAIPTTETICMCHPGYTGDPYVDCIDIDECSGQLDICSLSQPVEHCINSLGSYACWCPNGYVRNTTSDDCDDIDECQDSNLNLCDNNGFCTNTIGSYTCQCNTGFVGNGYDCQPLCPQCGANAYCVTQAGIFDTTVTCHCETGYTGDPHTICVDIDECDETTSVVHHCDTETPLSSCLNTIGSYVCLCPDGYRRVPPNLPCVDINECIEASHDCHILASCDNLVGSYNCTCPPGYIGNGKYCQPLCPECGINAVCELEDTGKTTCKCRPGMFGDPYVSCEDVDECVEFFLNDCWMTNDACFNTPGTYICICPNGLERDNTTGLCEDIDECFDGTHRCNSSGNCVNIVGDYGCSCPAGYTGNGYYCLSKEEQLRPCDVCGNNAECYYESDVLDFQCRCQPGNEVNGATGTCVDINECLLSPCSQNQTCTNYPSWFMCNCRSGFEPIGNDCIDIDECETNQHNCHALANCVNVDSSFMCNCPPGYTGDGLLCTKSEVCGISDICDPTSTCNDQVELGLYGCDCPPGTSGNGFTGCVGTELVACDPLCVPGQLCVVNTIELTAECVCTIGFHEVDGVCVDIDECIINPCGSDTDRECVNLMGSFQCICKSGLTEILQPSGFYICGNIDECASDTIMCSGNSFCLDLDPSSEPDGTGLPYQCVCKDGYDGNGLVCCEIDECILGEHDCSQNATCQNTEGSFDCFCLNGFTGDGKTCQVVCPETQKLAPNGINCTCDDNYAQNLTALPAIECYDINECEDNIDYRCDQMGNCVNIIGNYTCSGCIPPYRGSGYKGECCMEICMTGEECKENYCQCLTDHERDNTNGRCYPICKNGCGDHETCDRGDCVCANGYRRNQLGECEEIPCACHEHADCIDDPNTFIIERDCVCKTGLRGDGRTSCIDINECEEQNTNNSLCGEAACCNLFGGFVCVCECGFNFNFQNKTCHDIDECALAIHACEPGQLCHNEFGHHSCSCDPNECGILMGKKKFKQYLPCFKPEPYSP